MSLKNPQIRYIIAYIDAPGTSRSTGEPQILPRAYVTRARAQADALKVLEQSNNSDLDALGEDLASEIEDEYDCFCTDVEKRVAGIFEGCNLSIGGGEASKFTQIVIDNLLHRFRKLGLEKQIYEAVIESVDNALDDMNLVGDRISEYVWNGDVLEIRGDDIDMFDIRDVCVRRVELEPEA